MTEKKFKKIMDSVISEKMNEETHLFLTEYHVHETDSTFGTWGWSRKPEIIKNFVLYVASLKAIVEQNNVQQGTIRYELVDKLLNNKKISDEFLNSCNYDEKMFYFQFTWLKDSKGYEDLKKDVWTLVKVLNEAGYKLNIILYNNPYEALPKALELDEYLPEGELGFGEFLRSCLED